MPGKMTAFDTDIRVPLVIAGPGISAGITTPEIAENIDLYPTFLELTVLSPAPASTATALCHCCVVKSLMTGARQR